MRVTRELTPRMDVEVSKIGFVVQGSCQLHFCMPVNGQREQERPVASRWVRTEEARLIRLVHNRPPNREAR